MNQTEKTAPCAQGDVVAKREQPHVGRQLFVLLLCALMLTGLLQPISASETSILAMDFDGGLIGWNPNAKLAVENDPAGGIAGGAALKVTADAAPSGQYLEAIQKPKLEPDQYYTYSAKLRTDTGFAGTVQMAVVQFNASKAVVQDKYMNNVADTEGTWVTMSGTVKADPNVDYCQLRFFVTGTGTVWLDDVTLAPATEREKKRVIQYSNLLEEKMFRNEDFNFSGMTPNMTVWKDDVPEGLPEGQQFTVDTFWEMNKAQLARPRSDYASGSVSLTNFIQQDGEVLESIRFKLKVVDRESSPTLKITMREHGTLQRIPQIIEDNWWVKLNLDDYPLGEWVDIELKKEDFTFFGGAIGDENWEDIGPSIVLETSCDQSKETGIAEYKIAGLAGVWSGGTVSYILDPTEDLPMIRSGATNTVESTATNDGKVVIGVGGADFLSEEGRQHYLNIKNEMFSNLGVLAVLNLHSYTKAVPWFVENDISFGYQNGAAFSMGHFLTRREDGFGLAANGLSRDTSPGYGGYMGMHYMQDHLGAWIEGIEELIERMGEDYKIPEFQFTDYTWPYSFGSLIYADNTVQKFREFLKEEDIGITIKRFGSDETEKMYFWDYFEDLTGFRWTPQDLGLSSWDEYTPANSNVVNIPTSTGVNRKNYFVVIKLMHYGHLYTMERFGTKGDEHGVNFVVVPNPENWKNGVDQLYLLQHAKVDVASEEVFYTPRTSINGYFNQQFRIARENGKTIQTMLETGAGGHGDEYFAREVSYLHSFDTFTWMHSNYFEVDWNEAFWEISTDKVDHLYNYERFMDFHSKGAAFNHAKADDSAPEPEVGIIYRSLAETLHEGTYELTVPFRKLNLPASRTNFSAFETVKDSKVILDDYLAHPVGANEELSKWVNEKPGRALVLNGLGAGKTIDGTEYSGIYGWDWEYMNEPDLFSSILGGTVGIDTSWDGTGTLGCASEWKEYIPAELPDIINGGRYTLSNDYLNACSRGLKKKTMVWIQQGGDYIPLVTRVTQPNGSQVYYIQFKLNQTATQELERGILRAIMADSNVTPMMRYNPDLVVNTYSAADDSNVYTVYDNGTLEAIAPATPIRTYYPYKKDGINQTAYVYPQVKAQRYVVYDQITGQYDDAVIPEEDGAVRLDLVEKTVGLYYVFPYNESTVQEQLAMHHARYEEIHKNFSWSFKASMDLDEVQGRNYWYYQVKDGETYQDMTWDTENDHWTGANGLIGDSWMQAGDKPVVRKWVAPKDGTVEIKGTAKKAEGALSGNGVVATISRESETLWTQRIAGDDQTGGSHQLTVPVHEGDALYFTVDPQSDGTDDKISWDPEIRFDNPNPN